MKEEFIFSFDIPHSKSKNNWPFKIWVYRKLKRINAKMVQRSLWKSSNLNALINLATLIKEDGGKARIMEEKLIFE